MGVRKRETYVNVQCNPSPHLNTVLLLSCSSIIGQETKSVSVGSAAPLWSGLGRINRLRLFLPRIASFLWPPNNMMPISAESAPSEQRLLCSDIPSNIVVEINIETFDALSGVSGLACLVRLVSRSY